MRQVSILGTHRSTGWAWLPIRSEPVQGGVWADPDGVLKGMVDKGQAMLHCLEEGIALRQVGGNGCGEGATAPV